MEFHRSASKHGIEVDDAVHAVTHALAVADLSDDSPARTLHLGPDRAGNMLEVIVLYFDDDREMVIHAMHMRRQYRGMLPHAHEAGS